MKTEIIDINNKMRKKELKEKLERCKKVNLSEITFDDVDDLKDIKIDKRKSSNERILDFLYKVKNPYIFKCNGRLVKFSFSENSKSADDCLSDYLSKLYK